MPQEIYNEGRVVGLSAWEIYKRYAEGQDVTPENIPSESKWLTSMIGSGASMVLKIPNHTNAGILDIPLPGASNLSAAGVIVANPFLGECAWDDSNDYAWATKVTSYGDLISNVSGEGNYPTSASVPSGTYDPSTYSDVLSNYMKITDGIIYINNATWIQTPDESQGNPGIPFVDINPNFNESSTVIRLYISDQLDADVCIILTGFTNKRILQGLSGFAVLDNITQHSIGGSADVLNNDWADGGMLGPEIIPWASKIVFSVPSSLYNLANTLARTVPLGASDKYIDDKIHIRNSSATVKTNSFIDFDSIILTEYYDIQSYTVSPTLEENVTNMVLGGKNSYNSIVALYPGMTAAKIAAATDTSMIFPPAIYAAQVTSTGTQTLVPLDTAAPGTVKGFSDSVQAYNYTVQMPNNYSVYYNNVTNTFSFVTPGDSNPTHWAGTAKLEYLTAPKAQITAGSTTAKFIALTDSNNNDYSTNGQSAVISVGPANNLVWNNLLEALTSNASLDVLGIKLHNLGNELTSSNTIGITNSVDEVGANKFTITGSNSVNMTATTSNGTNFATLGTNQSIKSGTNFIEFSNGLRLYISASDPGTTNVPVGSIGIGW